MKRYFFFGIALALVSVVFFREPIVAIFNAVINREGSSHGLFVPFLSVFFIWTRRDGIKSITPRYDLLGIPLMAAAVALAFLAVGNYQFQFLVYILFISGLIVMMFGRSFFKPVAFPILFLITMIPIPAQIYEAIANVTRHISFGGSLGIISLFGITYLKTGWIIELPNATLKVARSCSGIRYLISYFVFGMAYGYLERETLRARVAILIAVMPISLGAGILRLTVIFVMTYLFGPKMAQWPHILMSWIVFFLILILMITLDQALQRRTVSKLPDDKDRVLSAFAKT